jgi:bifunctional non-homologous end joining protein LigD
MAKPRAAARKKETAGRSAGRGGARRKADKSSSGHGTAPVTAKLKTYRQKRHFSVTPEPAGGEAGAGRSAGRRKTATKSARKGIPKRGLPRFVVQMHDATRLHWDFRLEAEGVLKSWAVPKGPSLNPADKRLAVRTEDHPMEYIDFEGVIPEGEYGGGPVIVWDQGTYINIKQDRRGNPIAMSEALKKGTVEVWLEGEKLRGGYALIRTRPGADGKEHWLLIKRSDEEADPGRDIIAERPESMKTGRTIEDVLKTSGDRRQVAKKMARASWRRAEGNERPDKPPGGAKTKGPARSVSRRRTSAAASAVLPTRPLKKAAVPQWVDPMLATLVEDAPRGGDWLYEPKLDGFRALAFRDGDEVRLLSRNQKDLGERFPEIVEAVGKQPLDQFVVDGEVVALDENGRSSFSLLQQRLTPISLTGARRGRVRLYYYVFDLLFAKGYDTRDLPQRERLRLLRDAVSFRDPLRETEILEGDGAALRAEACRKGWEGLIGKQGDCPYIAGRARHWIKLKCLREQEFVIGGWTDPEGSRTGFGSLLLGYYERGGRGELRYAGKVGTGYTDKVLRDVLKLLKPLEQTDSPFHKHPQIPRKGVHFVRPQHVASIAFTEWTHDDHVRHPRFRGLRDDKDPREVRRETASEEG